MSEPTSAPPAPAEGPYDGRRGTLLLADARTATERRLVREWADRHHPGAPILALDDRKLMLAMRDGDPLVVPVRAVWLPPERDGDREVRPADLLLLAGPRRPLTRLQAQIARRSPDRVRVVDGAPARLSELRAAFAAEQGGDDATFAAFVRRRATVACDRAERVLVGDRYKVPRLVAEQLCASKPFRERVRDLADELGRPFEEVLEDAESCLNELVTVQSPLAIDVFRMVMRPMHGRAWSLDVDVESLERLREVNRRHALVFLPTHRSYVDPLVLADVLHEHDFPRNHMIGGDNMSFWPIGPLGKRAGVIFIRRSFGADRVYKLAVREYLGHLVAKRFNLEWYFEGGRTRTGKLRPPKLGLLHYLAAAIEDGRAEDVVLVPTSIVYDRQSEVAAMAAEQTGAGKRSEGLRWMAEYIRAQSRNVGSARVSFGESFSLREALAEAEGELRLDKVAFRVADGINRVTPVTSTSLVTLALLGWRDRALTLGQVARLCAPLVEYLEARRAPVADFGVRAALDTLVEAGVCSVYTAGTEPVWSIALDGHHVAAFYRNAGLHHFVKRAIVELAVLHAAEQEAEDPVDAAWEECLRLRDLLKFEFFFADKQRFREELLDELDLLYPGWREGGDAATLLAATRPLIAHRALRSFFDAQLVVADRLAQGRDPGAEATMQECLDVGRQLVLQGRLHGMEAVSKELFGAALGLYANRGVDAAEWRAEVEDVIRRLVRLHELDRATLEEALV